MKRYLPFILLPLLLAGCLTGGVDVNLPKHPEEQQSQSLSQALTNLKADALIDLDAAQAIAVAHQDVLAAACFPALKQFFMEKTGTGQPTVDQIQGVFSTYEKLRSERKAIEVSTAGGAGLPDYLKLGCAALLQDERIFALKLAALIAGSSMGVPGAAGAAGGAIKVIGPALLQPLPIK